MFLIDDSRQVNPEDNDIKATRSRNHESVRVIELKTFKQQVIVKS